MELIFYYLPALETIRDFFELGGKVCDDRCEVTLPVQRHKDMRAHLIQLNSPFGRKKKPAFAHLAPFYPHAAGKIWHGLRVHVSARASASPGVQAPGQGLPFT